MLRYRVKRMGRPTGEWHPSRRRAEQEALALGLGTYEDDGRFYLHPFGDIEEVHEYELRRIDAAARPVACKTRRAQEPLLARFR